jgi:hypothetical protein
MSRIAVIADLLFSAATVVIVATTAVTTGVVFNPTSAQTPEGRLATAPNHSSMNERIVGAWRLVDLYEENESGEDIAVFGTNPEGEFIASSSGHFSFQIVSGEGRQLGRDKQVITVRESGSGLREALAYFGTYSLDETKSTLTLQTRYCLFRSCDHTSRKTSVEIIDGYLVFTSVLGPSPTGSFYSRLRWRQEPADRAEGGIEARSSDMAGSVR